MNKIIERKVLSFLGGEGGGGGKNKCRVALDFSIRMKTFCDQRLYINYLLSSEKRTKPLIRKVSKFAFSGMLSTVWTKKKLLQAGSEPYAILSASF